MFFVRRGNKNAIILRLLLNKPNQNRKKWLQFPEWYCLSWHFYVFASLLSVLISEFSVSRMQVKRNCTMNMNQVRVRAGLQVHNFDFFLKESFFQTICTIFVLFLKSLFLILYHEEIIYFNFVPIVGICCS